MPGGEWPISAPVILGPNSPATGPLRWRAPHPTPRQIQTALSLPNPATLKGSWMEVSPGTQPMRPHEDTLHQTLLRRSCEQAVPIGFCPELPGTDALLGRSGSARTASWAMISLFRQRRRNPSARLQAPLQMLSLQVSAQEKREGQPGAVTKGLPSSPAQTAGSRHSGVLCRDSLLVRPHWALSAA